MISKNLIFLIIMVVIIIIVASNSTYFNAFNHIYKSLMKIPKLVIMMVTILSLLGISQTQFYEQLGFKPKLKTLDDLSGLNETDASAPKAPVPEGLTPTKRQVSETVKKAAAARQNWKCGLCGQILDETFEVDHIDPLYKGGSNDLNNLMALDPICHRKKTNADRLNVAASVFM